jgi:hypothetical protein
MFGSSLTWGFRHTCVRKQNGEYQIPAVVRVHARMFLVNLCRLFVVHLLFKFRLRWDLTCRSSSQVTVKVTLPFERHIAAWTVEFWSSVCSVKVLPFQVVERQPVNSQVFGERKENQSAETHLSREISGQ